MIRRKLLVVTLDNLAMPSGLGSGLGRGLGSGLGSSLSMQLGWQLAIAHGNRLGWSSVPLRCAAGTIATKCVCVCVCARVRMRAFAILNRIRTVTYSNVQ